MPVSYRFHNNDGPISLASVDDWICKRCGFESDPDRFHYVFDLYVDTLISILVAFGGSEITCQHILEITEKNSVNIDDPVFYDLIETFDFEAWR